MVTKEVLESVSKNPEFVQKLAGIKDPQQAYDLLKEKGLTDSFEDFKKAATEIKEADSKLSAEDIDAVAAGGSGTITTLTTTTTVTITASAAAAV